MIREDKPSAFRRLGFHINTCIAGIAEKFNSSAIPAIIWKPNFSDLSDSNDRDSSKNLMAITFSDPSDQKFQKS